jgi:hypothetical protein
MSHHRGHDATAYDAARSLRERSSETGNRQHRAWGLRCLAVWLLRRGEAGEALAHLRAALEALGETAALNERIPTLGLLALAQLRTGEVWAARATAKEGLAQMVRVSRPIGHGALEGYSALTAVSLDAWRAERSPEWRAAIHECLRVLRRFSRSFPIGEPRYYFHAGEYKRLSGDRRGARRIFERGLRAASRLGMPWESKQCRDSLEDG